jgi:transcriptional regulator with XRE-family HTH domain
MYKAGIRQNTLAKSLGINEAYLSRIINGTREPGAELRQQIAIALKEDTDWLFQRSRVDASPLTAA